VASRRSRQAPAKKGDPRPPQVVAEVPAADAQGYVALVVELKQRIADARLRAALSVNRELVLLYWGIGRDILSRQESEGWGAKVIDRLAIDLGRAFPEMTGLSAPKPQLCACVRRGVARSRICATGCCTIALGP
jgi:hypothetical protein